MIIGIIEIVLIVVFGIAGIVGFIHLMPAVKHKTQLQAETKRLQEGWDSEKNETRHLKQVVNNITLRLALHNFWMKSYDFGIEVIKMQPEASAIQANIATDKYQERWEEGEYNG